MVELSIDEALQKGIEAHQNGELQLADRYYTAIIKAQPNHPEANHNMGVLAVSLGKLEVGLPFLQTALKANPKKSLFWLSLLDTLLKLENYGEAKKVLKQAKASGVSGEKIDQFTELLEENNGKHEEADTPKVDAGPTPEQLKELTNLFHSGQLDDVVKLADKLLKTFPKSVSLLNILGAAFNGLKQYESAIKHYQHALELKPNAAEIHNNLGVIYKNTGLPELAIENFENAIRINSSYSDAYYNLGNTYSTLNELSRAVETFNAALEITPKSSKILNNLGITLRKIGDYAAAIHYLERARVLAPNTSEIYDNLAGTYLANSDIISAKKYFRRALVLNPSNVNTAWNVIAIANDIPSAKELIQKCLMLDRNHEKAKILSAALNYFTDNSYEYDLIMNSPLKSHPSARSLNWIIRSNPLPKMFFNRWDFFDFVSAHSNKSRPFYEFGVWKGVAFEYLLKIYPSGYGFDTFIGLPEKWHSEDVGTYSAQGQIPNYERSVFVEGKFEETLPNFFSQPRPTASLINFDADLYSSTICALQNCFNIIDEDTILVFDEFLVNDSWEQDEHRALIEFCDEFKLEFDVIAVSLVTKQVAVKIRQDQSKD